MNSAFFPSDLLAHLDQRPLRFTQLFRNPVSRGGYCGMHSHSTLEIVHHPAGRGETRISGGGAYRFDTGGTVIYAPGQAHDQRTETSGEDVCIHLAVPAESQAQWPGCVSLGRELGPLIQGDVDFLVTHAHRGAASPHWRAILDLRATALLLTLLGEGAPAALPAGSLGTESSSLAAERHVEAAERFLRENFARIQGLDEVAAHVGVGLDHLRHLYKARRGASLLQTLRRLRVERAARLLAETDQPLKQIAGACGFRDEYYFNSVFSSATGRSPAAFRRAAS